MKMAGFSGAEQGSAWEDLMNTGDGVSKSWWDDLLNSFEKEAGDIKFDKTGV